MNELTKKQKKLKQLNDWKNSPIAKESSKFRPKKVKFDPVISFLNACLDFDQDEIDQMLADGIDIDCCDNDDLTALHQACINSNIVLVEYLLKKRANINAIDKECWTPLHITCKIGDYELTRLLIENGARLDIANVDGDLPFHLIEDNKELNNKELKKYVGEEIKKRKIDIKKVVDMESTLMLQDIEKWKRLGKYDPPIDEVNKSTPLHVAASKNYSDVITALLPLLSQSQLDAQDIDGWTALHAAAHWGHFDVCSVLIKAGANHKIKTFSEETIYDLVDNENQQTFEIKMDEVIKAVENNKKFDGLFPQPALRGDGNTRRKSSIMRQSLELKKSAQMKEPQSERKALSVLYDHKEIDDETAEDNDLIDDGDKEILEKARYNNQLDTLDLSYINMNVRNRRPNKSIEVLFDSLPEEIEECSTQIQSQDETEELTCTTDTIGSENTIKKDNLINDNKPQNPLESGTSEDSIDNSETKRVHSSSIPDSTKHDEIRSSPKSVPAPNTTEIIKPEKIRTAQQILEDNKTKTEGIIAPKLSEECNDSDVDCNNEHSSPNTSWTTLEKFQVDNDDSVQIRSQRASLAMPPGKVEQAEVERRDIARRVRSTRRSTQGITGEEIRSVEQKFETLATVAENDNKRTNEPVKIIETVPHKNASTPIVSKESSYKCKSDETKAQFDTTDRSPKSIQTSVPNNKAQRHSSLTHASARSNIMSFLGNKIPQRPSSQLLQTKPQSINETDAKPSKVTLQESKIQKNNEPVGVYTQNSDKKSPPTTNVPLSFPTERKPFGYPHDSKLSDGNYVAKHVTGNAASTTSSSSISSDLHKGRNSSRTNVITPEVHSKSDLIKPQSDPLLSSPVASNPSITNATDEYSDLPKKISKKLIDDELEKKGLFERIKELEAQNQLLQDELKTARSKSNKEQEIRRNSIDENHRGDNDDDEKTNLKNEVERYRNENRTLRSRQEALLRVINKIQGELETVHTINHSNDSNLKSNS